MDKVLLETKNILRGYEAVSSLYPFVPPITFWRAWEYAAFKRYKLTELVLDIGCGDGRFFNLVWPDLQHVSGIDIKEGVILEARITGIYEQLVASQAHDPKFLNVNSYGSNYTFGNSKHKYSFSGKNLP